RVAGVRRDAVQDDREAGHVGHGRAPRPGAEPADGGPGEPGAASAGPGSAGPPGGREGLARLAAVRGLLDMREGHPSRVAFFVARGGGGSQKEWLLSGRGGQSGAATGDWCFAERPAEEVGAGRGERRYASTASRSESARSRGSHSM